MDEGDAHSIYLDRNEEIVFKQSRYLPHWHQNNKLQFITFRLNDSLPFSIRNEINNFIQDYKKIHPEPWDQRTLYSFKKVVSDRMQKTLDNGYGSCVLSIPAVRKFLSDAILYHDGEAYDVLAYVIMPNHVHMLLLVYDNICLNKIIQSIKSFSARRINKFLERDGALWMKSYFDRIVRSEDEHKFYINYIIRNPRNLRSSQYELYLHWLHKR